MLREAAAPSGSEETPEVASEPTSLWKAWVAGPGNEGIAVLVPLTARVVVAENRGIGFGLVSETERQVAFDKTLQRLWHMRRRLIIVDDAFEAVHRSQVLTALKVVPTDFHFLTRQMVAGKIKFELGIACIFTVGETPHHIIERL